MNFTKTYCQPCYYYKNNAEHRKIKPNLRRTLVSLDELQVLSDGIEIIQVDVQNLKPFTSLIKVIEEDKIENTFSVKGYYLICKEMNINLLKQAIDSRLVGKRLLHPAFGDKEVMPALKEVVLSYDDDYILIEKGKTTKLIPRKKS